MSSNGNGNGGDDDRDVDKLVDALNQTNANIEDLTSKVDRLVEGLTRATREEAGAEEEERSYDLWDVGKMSPGHASTPEDYVRLRAKTAKSEDLSVPRVGRDLKLVPFFLEVYRMSGEHLQRIYFALNNQQWKDFIQQLAILYGADKALVDLLNPGPSSFGIVTTEKEVEITPSMSHMNFVRMYGNYWFGSDVDVAPKKYSGPSEALGLPVDTEAENIFGRLTDADMNRSLARGIEDRRDLTLPDEYRHLL